MFITHTHTHISSLWTIAVGIVQGVDSLVTPALKSIMSKAVDAEDQGMSTIQWHAWQPNCF